MSSEQTYKAHEAEKALYRSLVFGTQVAEVINFYRQSRDMAESELHKTQDQLQEISEKRRELLTREAFYSRFPCYLRNNTFLMLFSLVEELLASAYEILTKGSIPATDHRGLTRFLDIYRGIGIRLGSARNWEFLRRCQTVRNVLLHANGRTSLFSKQDELQKVLSPKWKKFFGTREGLIQIKQKGTSKSQFIDVKVPAVNQLLEAYYELEKLILGPEEQMPTNPST